MTQNWIKFHKYSATGNDFILIDSDQHDLPIKQVELWKSLCQRRTGIGADGVLFYQKSQLHDFKMKYLNSDGHEASMCGNGARAMVLFAKTHRISHKNELSFETKNAIYNSRVTDNLVSLEMPEEKDFNEINLDFVKEFNNRFYLNTGVEHLILESNISFESMSLSDSRNYAEKIRKSSELGPRGANINFYKLIDRNTIKVKTYEKGVEDFTLACGTGVMAVATALKYQDMIADNVDVICDGGKLNVEFKNNKKYLIGKAEEIYSGKFDLEQFNRHGD